MVPPILYSGFALPAPLPGLGSCATGYLPWPPPDEPWPADEVPAEAPDVVPLLAAAAGDELTLDVAAVDMVPEYPPDVLPMLGKLFPALKPPLLKVRDG